MSDAGRPRRVRVTAEVPPARRGAGPTRGIALPGAPVDEADEVFARALRTTQLRLALGTVLGFVVVFTALTLLIAVVPELDRVAVLGVPLSWLLHAFAFYPVIIVSAALYARAAARNEARYVRLRGRE